MRETVTIQVGQCGNQIGNEFWKLLLQEHEHTPDTDDALSAFFRFSPQKNGRTHAMKARALLIDRECGPLQETMRSPLGALFDETQFVMDVYGAGNNFAHGHCEYGPRYRSNFEEGLRRNAEHCDSLQTFIVTHSLSGGTGSGVGTYVLGMLEDLYPEIYRFSACVFPSEDNDVVTSPYNSVLATKQLIEHADCVLPIDNRALQAFAALEASQRQKKRTAAQGTRAPMGTDELGKKKKDKGFDDMNGVAARMLCHLTSSSRFHGEMNVDLNEICTNLVPFPRLQFLMTALSPQRAPSGGVSVHDGAFTAAASTTSSSSSGGSGGAKGGMQRAFNDVLSRHGQLTAADPQQVGCVTLASAFIARGAPTQVRLSDFLNGVTNAQRALRFPAWNEHACKIGLCNTPSPGEDMSLLCVYNSTAFGSTLTRERDRFNVLFRRRAMLHHYLEFIDVESVAEAERWSAAISAEYQALEQGTFNGRQRQFRDSSPVVAQGGEGSFSIFRDPVLFPAF